MSGQTEREAFFADVALVSRFVAGWWPGLEDGISWGDHENYGEHPVYLAAVRLRDRPARSVGSSLEESENNG